MIAFIKKYNICAHLSQPFFDNLKIDNKNRRLGNRERLPLDLIKKIYYDYYHFNNIYDEIYIILNAEDSRDLDNTSLKNYFKVHKLLDCPEFVQYLCKKDSIFNNIYNTHYEQNKISFIRMDKMSSMFQCWLMYLYH